MQIQLKSLYHRKIALSHEINFLLQALPIEFLLTNFPYKSYFYFAIASLKSVKNRFYFRWTNQKLVRILPLNLRHQRIHQSTKIVNQRTILGRTMIVVQPVRIAARLPNLYLQEKIVLRMKPTTTLSRKQASPTNNQLLQQKWSLSNRRTSTTH